mgnify:CR=1 FL=1
MPRILSRVWAVLLALGLCGVGAERVHGEGSRSPVPGALHVYLNEVRGFFSDKGIAQAKEVMEKTHFSGGLAVTVDVLARPPQGRQVPADEKQRGQFFLELARELATADRARGIYILVCRSPGYVQVITDRATRERGFTSADERKVRDILLEGFREAEKLEKENAESATQRRDAALVAAVRFVVDDLRNTSPPASSQAQHPATSAGGQEIGGNSLAGWICMGLVALLAVWLIVGFIRALSGMGTAAGAGGGGGGGFFSSLLGGLFGAMAGMWLYNHLFGGSSFWSGDSSGLGSAEPTSSGGIAGEGDFSGDTGAGGSFDAGDTGDTGGGDFGGGDFGGGDFSGGDVGGGDFGGGDFGGGDF